VADVTALPRRSTELPLPAPPPTARAARAAGRAARVAREARDAFDIGAVRDANGVRDVSGVRDGGSTRDVSGVHDGGGARDVSGVRDRRDALDSVEPAESADSLESLDVQDSKLLRRGFGAFPTGVAALAAVIDGEPVGMAVNSFTSVSLDPPLVSICAATTSQTWRTLRAASRLGISVLSATHEQTAARLAARGVDRFAGLAWQPTGDGAVLLGEASAWFECAVEREIRAGDHDIVVLRVHRFGLEPLLPPLVFHGSRFRSLAD